MSKRIWKKPLKTVLAAGLVANLLIPVIPLTTEAATKAAENKIELSRNILKEAVLIKQ